MRRMIVLLLVAAFVASGPAALAHPHTVVTPGTTQKLANGQNHPAFVGGTSCESFGGIGGDAIGPSWYGMETAHHGPDAGTPGKANGCYQTTGNVPPGQDVQNPVIR
jgi:hypothetical protein